MHKFSFKAFFKNENIMETHSDLTKNDDKTLKPTSVLLTEDFVILFLI